MARNIIMTEGDVRRTISRLALPMVFGILGLIIFNLVDTYFVSLLGTMPLAALTFTYPVVLTLNSVTLGIGMGTASVVSRAVGEKNRDHVARFATDSLMLGLVVSVLFVAIGLMTIDPLFRLLGADGTVLSLIKEYMRIWYIGTIFVVIPMIGNNSIRALGDTRTPSLIMMVAAGVNTLLDPVLIFGLGPFPRLEVAGAAVATVFSRMITFSVALYILGRRERILSLKGARPSQILQSWKKILYIGVPNALIRVIQPLGVGIITGLLAQVGLEAVAGFGIAAKVERFAVILIGALSAVLVPYFGQNFGARKLDRIRKGMRFSIEAVLASSLVIYLLLWVAAPTVGGWFSDDPAVVAVMVRYLHIVALLYGLFGVQQIGNAFFNAINQPVKATAITAFQMFIVFIPLALWWVDLREETGIFAALAVSYILGGGLAYSLMKFKMKEWKREIDSTFHQFESPEGDQ